MFVNLQCLYCSNWCHCLMGESPRTWKERSPLPWSYVIFVPYRCWAGLSPSQGVNYLLFKSFFFVHYSNCWFLYSVSYPVCKFLESYDHDLNLILLTCYKNCRIACTQKCTLDEMFLHLQCSLKVLPFWNILSKVRRALGEFKNLSLVLLSLLLKTLFLISGDQLLEVFMIYTLLLLRDFPILGGSLFLGCCSVP